MHRPVLWKKTDPFIYYIIWNVDPFIYCHLIFCIHLLLVVRQIIPSIHWIPRGQAASKISKWKISVYTGKSEKVGPLIYQTRKIGPVMYLSVAKRGLIIYLAALKKGAIRHAHPYYAIYRKLPRHPPPPPPHTHTHPELIPLRKDDICIKDKIYRYRWKFDISRPCQERK